MMSLAPKLHAGQHVMHANATQEFMAKCGDASTSPHLTLPTALPELKAREGGEFREGPPPNTHGGFGCRGGGCAPPTP